LEAAGEIVGRSTTHGESDGRRIVEALLAGRGLEDLSVEELRVLGQGYNWCMEHAEAYRAWRLALSRAPDDEGALQDVRAGLLNLWYHSDAYPDRCDELIREGAGPAAFWRLEKAEYFVRTATEERTSEFVWERGDPVARPELLELAAREIAAAVAERPDLFGSHPGWVRGWDERFAPLIQDPRFRHLSARGLRRGRRAT
jgi:hypothetical protein